VTLDLQLQCITLHCIYFTAWYWLTDWLTDWLNRPSILHREWWVWSRSVLHTYPSLCSLSHPAIHSHIWNKTHRHSLSPQCNTMHHYLIYRVEDIRDEKYKKKRREEKREETRKERWETRKDKKKRRQKRREETTDKRWKTREGSQ